MARARSGPRPRSPPTRAPRTAPGGGGSRRSPAPCRPVTRARARRGRACARGSTRAAGRRRGRRPRRRCPRGRRPGSARSSRRTRRRCPGCLRRGTNRARAACTDGARSGTSAATHRFEARVPAAVIRVQVRVHHRVDPLRREAGVGEALEERPAALVPERQGALLAVAHARVDQHAPPLVSITNAWTRMAMRPRSSANSGTSQRCRATSASFAPTKKSSGGIPRVSSSSTLVSVLAPTRQRWRSMRYFTSRSSAAPGSTAPSSRGCRWRGRAWAG